MVLFLYMARKALLVALIWITLSYLNVLSVHAMTSTNFQILWDSVNIGGDDISSSTNYRLRDTVGEHGSGTSTSENFRLSAGYRVGDVQEPTLTFGLGTQENSTETAYSSFSDAGNTVALASASGFSVGDFIGVVENSGLSQLIAVGKINDITGATITVDDWGGEPASLSGVPLGSDDFAYRLNGTAAQLGNQSITAGKTSVTRTNVISNASNGYSVQILADGGLRASSTQVMTDVSDGAVTVGVEEYGAELVGSTAAGAGGDFAFSSTGTRVIQQSAALGRSDRVGVIYKLAIAASTSPGSYAQTITYTVTGNF